MNSLPTRQQVRNVKMVSFVTVCSLFIVCLGTISITISVLLVYLHLSYSECVCCFASVRCIFLTDVIVILTKMTIMLLLLMAMMYLLFVILLTALPRFRFVLVAVTKVYVLLLVAGKKQCVARYYM